MGSVLKLEVSDPHATSPIKQTLHQRIEALAHRLEYRRMVDFEDREAVYFLRRKAYARANQGVEDWAAGTIDDPREENADTIGLFFDGRLVGSVKVTVATQAYPNCQSRKYSPKELDKLLDTGGIVIDPGRLVADVDAARELPELPFLLLRVAMVACQYFNAQYCLSLVNQKHSSFYGRVFNAVPIDGPIWCDPLQCELTLLAGDLEKDLDVVLDRFPFWKATYLEMRQMFGPLEGWKCMEQQTSAA